MTILRTPILLTTLLAAFAGGCQRGPVANETAGEPTPHGQAPTAADDPGVVHLTAASAARHGIATEAVAPRTLRRHLTVPARLAFAEDRIVHIGAALRGRIADAPAALGATVARGDVLLAVDSPELGEAQIAFLQARSRIELLQPKVALADEAWQRGRSLLEDSHGIAQGEVRRREAELALARAEVRAAELAADAAANRLLLLGMRPDQVQELARRGEIQPRLVVTAPQAGLVTMRHCTRGELIAPEDTLMTIVDTGALWVLAQVPETRLADVRVGAVTVVRAAGAEFTGKVALIAPTVDEATRTATVRIELPGDARLRAGMFAEARIELADGPQATPTLAIAEAAVQTIDRRTVVFVPVAGEANAFAMRPVEVGPPSEGYVPIRAGLAAGERVVTTGSFVLKAQATQAGGDEGEDK